MIKIVGIEDWKDLRDLRLKALKDAPKAYGLAYEDEAIRSDDDWKRLCQDAVEDRGKWYFAAYHGDKAVGILGATEMFGTHMRHQVEIVSAYVDEAFRGRGIFTKLFYALRDKLQTIPHLEQMIAWVTLHETQTGKEVFEKFGFKLAGTLSKTVKYEGKYYDCCWLESELQYN